jgi:hypothetical protein
MPRYNQFNIEAQCIRFQNDIYTLSFLAQCNKPMPRLFVRSNWCPPLPLINKDLCERTVRFTTQLTMLHQKVRARSNLLPFQRAILSEFRDDRRHLIIQADKNLGPCILERDTYIRRSLTDHLLDDTTYRQLNKREAHKSIKSIRTKLDAFMSRFKLYLTKADATFLERTFNVEDPFPKFYITAKVHKYPWKTRPIVSISGSLLDGLGKWVDKMLQPFTHRIHSYVNSSFRLKEILLAIPPLPQSARLFTADATSMYTNIDTTHALGEIKSFLRTHKDLATGQERTAIHTALEMVMTNNLFQFGDTYWLQINGTAMGVSPSCCYAMIYFALHEESLVRKYPELIFFKRYIDDILAIWVPRQANDYIRWKQFQADLNNFGKLKWEISERTTSTNFLDINIKINQHGEIDTSLYEKKENYYLYLPATSAHPPGCLKGVIYGMVYRSLRLTSVATTQQAEIQNLYLRLRARGYDRNFLIQAISKAYTRVATKLKESSPTDTQQESERRTVCFFHRQYHPKNPPTKEIQRIFQKEMLQRPNRPYLQDLPNSGGHKLGINKLLVCHSRPPNLGNLLSPRILKLEHGPAVSSYMD